MGRWLATIGIGMLLVVDLVIPGTSLGRRGSEAAVRSDVDAALPSLGEPLPDLAFEDLEARPVRISDLRGHRVLITFERSVDW